MILFDDIFLNCIYILFPFSIYLIFTSYARNTDKRTKKLFLEIALFSSLYLIFRFGRSLSSIYPMIIFNIPLLIAYLKKKNLSAIFMSLLLVVYYHQHVGLSTFLLVLEYAIYFFSYNYFKCKKSCPICIITNFVVIKSFIMSFEMFLIFDVDSNIFYNYLSIFATMIIFTFIAYLCLYFINKGEEINDLNKTIHELEKEKDLRNSLFKITHEIKNPIAVCKGYLDMIDYNNELKIRKYIPIVKDQIARTLILMDDFLDYTKVELTKDDVDLYMLLEDSCDVSRPLFKKAGIKLLFDIPDEELYMDLDYNRLKQVFVNMFKNSIEAKDDKKADKFVKVGVLKAKDSVTIKIKDNGIGMDKKTLLRVDEMFYTTKDKGTGLGVALSKEIIELHGGSIKYSSIKDKYTLVTIKLPIEENKKDN